MNDARGFTLIEVLLVLTLLVTVAALAMPSMSAGMGRSQMTQAAEQVRNSWAKARLEAAASGEAMRFQCRIGAGWGYVATATATQEEVGEALAEAGPVANAAEPTREEYELSGVVFKKLLVAAQPGDPALGEAVVEGELSAAILFRPDGSSSDAEAWLEDDEGRQLKVTLRGLTGMAKIEDVVDE